MNLESSATYFRKPWWIKAGIEPGKLSLNEQSIVFLGEENNFELPISGINSISFKKKAAILINTGDNRQYGFVLFPYNEYQDTLTKSAFGSTRAIGIGFRPWAILKGLLDSNAIVSAGKRESVRWQTALAGKVRFK